MLGQPQCVIRAITQGNHTPAARMRVSRARARCSWSVPAVRMHVCERMVSKERRNRNVRGTCTKRHRNSILTRSVHFRAKTSNPPLRGFSAMQGQNAKLLEQPYNFLYLGFSSFPSSKLLRRYNLQVLFRQKSLLSSAELPL